MSRLPLKQASITRAVKAMENAGWPRGSFTVRIEGSVITLLPIDAAADEAADIERRMVDAFGGGDRAAALRP